MNLRVPAPSQRVLFMEDSDEASAQQAAYEQLAALHRRLERVRDEERSGLARELHDELGQTLTALKLRLKLLPRAAAQATTPTAQLDDALVMVDALIDRVRKISSELRPPLLDELGLESALRAFVDTQARGHKTHLQLETAGLVRLSPELEIACFRFVQEAVFNALRHAGATRIAVRVARDAGGQLSISVLDDGCGLTSAQARAALAAGGYGLIAMRERARALGGELIVTSPPASGETGGTRVEVQLPAPARPASEPY